jgi:tRNA (adenine57-N1/adenine58-N1)-methyltransferase
VVLVYNERDSRYFIRMLAPGRELHTHLGVLKHDDLIGQPFGSRVRTHLGARFLLLTPTTDELVRNLRRTSQIIYPKDSGYMLLKLGIQPGSQVLEAGTGSGGLCLVLAMMVGEQGHVTSYDVRQDLQDVAQKNLTAAGLDSRVTFKLRDAEEGFDETDLDAVILDMLKPWVALDQAHAALRGGGMLGCIVPTVNQLSRLILELQSRPHYGFVEAEELILRPYKTLPDRVRPEDRITGHTGFLVFARALLREQEAPRVVQSEPADLNEAEDEPEPEQGAGL